VAWAAERAEGDSVLAARRAVVARRRRGWRNIVDGLSGTGEQGKERAVKEDPGKGAAWAKDANCKAFEKFYNSIEIASFLGMPRGAPL
jgi:hypothetical protein